MTPVSAPRRSWPLFLLGGLLLLALLGFAAFQVAVHLLQGQVLAALGPRAELRELRVGLGGVEILGLRLPAEPGAGKGAWPAPDQLRAERVLVVPSLADLLGARVVLSRIRVEGAYLSLLRTRDGRLRVLPGLTEGRPQEEGGGREEADGAASGTPVSVGSIELVDGAVEFFDASVRQPALKIRLEQLQARLDELRLPDLGGRSKLQLDGVLKGQRQDGRLQLEGEVELASRESDLKLRLQGVDLTALQPYLIKAAETGVRRGSLDLEVHSVVRQGRLRGPGTLTLQDLELAPGGNAFMGMPRQAVVAMMQDRRGRISVQFVLEGDINDPRFSLNENLMTRVGSSVAGVLGISLEDLAKGVGSAGGSIAKGLGESLGKLLGR